MKCRLRTLAVLRMFVEDSFDIPLSMKDADDPQDIVSQEIVNSNDLKAVYGPSTQSLEAWILKFLGSTDRGLLAKL